MAGRVKEDERNEKIIRGLLKLPANRRCINCNNLGPQYVCTNFWTFICTNCSGLHREFCHRVKSISMAKFTTQEVSALQEGGNEKAREIYFKEWDPVRNGLPDGSNIDRLRDFIKHVYVDRRFSGGRNNDRPPRGKADQDDPSDGRRGDSYRGGSRSPAYDDPINDRLGNGRRNGDRNIRYVYGERSPGYDPSDNKRSPRRFEVVDDRVRDDRFGGGNQIRRFEDRRLPDVVTKSEGSSPSRQKDVSTSPAVRPVRDILGDDAPKLHVGDPSRSNDTPQLRAGENHVSNSTTSVPDSSAPTLVTPSSSNSGSTNENSAQLKRVNSGSLIDFSSDPEPPVTVAPQQPIPQQANAPTSDAGGWAAFGNEGKQIPSQAPTNMGTLEAAVAQLSTPLSTTQLPVFGVGTSPKTNDGAWSTVQQHQPSFFPTDVSQPGNVPGTASFVGGQSWSSSTVPNAPGVGSRPSQETGAGVSSQPPPVEAKPTGRKELPADIFTSLYPSAPAPVPGWHRGPHPGMGYRMQYPMGMPQTMPTYPHPSKSTNPFDLGGEPALANALTFPSMGSLQGALPHVPGPPPPLLRSSSFGNPSPQQVLQQQSSFLSAMPRGQYMMQQVPGNMPQLPYNNMVMMGHQHQNQTTGGPGTPAALLGNSGMDQLPAGRYSLPSTPNFGSPSGNPFG